MRFRPRHYVLIAIIFALFFFNLYRRHRTQPGLTPTPTIVTHFGPPVDTPAWRAFDSAAALRDAPDTQFQPALQNLQQQISLSASDPATADVKGCVTWLEFYRQGAFHTSTDPQWKTRTQSHIISCIKYHADTTA